MSPLGPTWPATLTEPPARTRPLRTVSTWLVPLPHRPPLDTRCTLQVPSNCAGSARAEPDRITPTVRPIAATARVTLLVKVGIVTSPCFQPHRLKQSGPADREPGRSASVSRPDQVLPREGASGSVERHRVRERRCPVTQRQASHVCPCHSISTSGRGGRLMRALVTRRTARLDRFGVTWVPVQDHGPPPVRRHSCGPHAQRAVNARTLRHVWTPLEEQEKSSGAVWPVVGC